MSDNKDNVPPERIWINRGSGNVHTAVSKKSILDECECIEYIHRSTADDDKSSLVKCNNELMRLVEELEYKLEKANREREEILKPIRDVWKEHVKIHRGTITTPIIMEYYAKFGKAVLETLSLADKVK